MRGSFSAATCVPAPAARPRRGGDVRVSAPGGAARTAWAGFPLTADCLAQLERRAERLVLEAFPGSTLEFEERGPDTTPQWMLYRAYWPVERRWDQRWIWCSPAEVASLTRKVT